MEGNRVMAKRKCEQNCGADAQCYAQGRGAGDWAGHYCFGCAMSLKFNIVDEYSECCGAVKSVDEHGNDYCKACYKADSEALQRLTDIIIGGNG